MSSEIKMMLWVVSATAIGVGFGWILWSINPTATVMIVAGGIMLAVSHLAGDD